MVGIVVAVHSLPGLPESGFNCSKNKRYSSGSDLKLDSNSAAG
jgi:hypothetical protein